VSGLGPGDGARLAAVAEAAARAGGDVVARHFGRLAAGVHSKAPGDYVSEVDVASEEVIRAALERDAPGIAFFGEEGGGTRGDLGWVVDPLDGTANFLHGFPIVGVSVALVEAGRPVAGAVHAPMLDETYTAAAGGGAAGPSGSPTGRRPRPSATPASPSRASTASTTTAGSSRAPSSPWRTSAGPAPPASTWPGRRPASSTASSRSASAAGMSPPAPCSSSRPGAS